ncbi:MAG TPA: pirin family protein [Polyangiaceae bacterium]|nr:pirin family protein [Polyangiaceae bacterium]
MIDSIIEPRLKDLGGFAVRRVLPSVRRRHVGPFVFLDHMGPSEFAPGNGLDVRPHPHINLATVTYLWEGVVEHRDSIGSHQAIQPGAINWMTAGSGIVHSERTPLSMRAATHRLHGIQLWVALPEQREEMPPEFHHHPASTLPVIESGGVELRLLAGAAFGGVSPVRVHSPLFYADAWLRRGQVLTLPGEYPERAVYLVQGSIECAGAAFDQPRLLAFDGPLPIQLRATEESRLLLLGGAPLEGPRYMWWNFVSSSKQRIERAKQDWSEGRFPLVPGDERERVPLPNGP